MVRLSNDLLFECIVVEYDNSKNKRTMAEFECAGTNSSTYCTTRARSSSPCPKILDYFLLRVLVSMMNVVLNIFVVKVVQCIVSRREDRIVTFFKLFNFF